MLIVEAMPGAGLLEFYEREARAAGTLGMLPGDAMADAPLLPTADQLPQTSMQVPPNWTGTIYGTRTARPTIPSRARCWTCSPMM